MNYLFSHKLYELKNSSGNILDEQVSLWRIKLLFILIYGFTVKVVLK